MQLELLTDRKFNELVKNEVMLHNFTFPIARCDSKTGKRYLEARGYIVPEELNKKAIRLYNRTKRAILKGISKGELVFTANGSETDSKLDDKVGFHRINTTFTNAEGKVFFIEILRCCNKEHGFYADMIIDRQKEKEYERTCEEIRKYNLSVKYPNRKKHLPATSYYVEREAYNNGQNIEKDFTITNVINYINEKFGCNYTKASVHPYMFRFDEYLCSC